MILRAFRAFRQSVTIVPFAVCALIAFSTTNVGARQETIEGGRELRGIPFDEFWSIIQDEGKKWAGDKLYIAKISSGTFRRFDKHDGLSSTWEAQIVKCSEITERNEHGRTLTRCKGRMKVLRLVESGIIGLEAGLHVKKEGVFHGAAVDFERIRFSAQSAELVANQHMHYRSSGYDNYAYDLKADQFSNRPVWTIRKACGLKGVQERRCRSKDHWIVKVDGETGEIIR